MAVLKWESSGPVPNPFEAVAGGFTEYCVHIANCDSTEDGNLRAALADVIRKSLSFASTSLSGIATRLLFLWDAVYADLTVVYADESMMEDAPQVTKCTFVAFGDQLDEIAARDEDEWEEASEALSARIRRLLEDQLASCDLRMLPPRMTVYFSDQERSSGPSEFVAHQITTR